VIFSLLVILLFLLYDGGYFDLFFDWFLSLFSSGENEKHPTSPVTPPRFRPERVRARQLGSPNVSNFSSDDIVEQLDPNADRHLHIEHIILIRERKTLVLDLDETLVHSSLNPNNVNFACDFTVQVPLANDSVLNISFLPPHFKTNSFANSK
jgi:hypothetical protein